MKEKVSLEEKKMYFTMALSLYMTEHNITNEDMQFLIPRLFLVLYDVDLKNRILVEALNKEILIEETDLYKQLLKDNDYSDQLLGGVQRN